MRRLLLAIATLAFTVPLTAQVRFTPSGRGTSEIAVMGQDSGAAPVVIRLDWGQPHLRGRTLHIDSLVPYGQVWRTGANATTKLHTDLHLMFGNAHIPSGTYAVFTLPSRNGWQLILQKDIGQTIADYDASKDVARIPLQHRVLTSPVESLTMWLIPAAASAGMRGELRMAWGTTELSVSWMTM